MSMFDFSVAKNANQVTTGSLRGGIHTVIFKGVEWIPSQNESSSNSFDLIFEANGITHRERIFDPSTKEGCTTRRQTQYGESPSDVENFMIKITQIITALNPELGARISSGEKIQIGSFRDLYQYIETNLKNAIGTETQIKLIPYKSYNSFPTFVSTISKDGVVRSRTKIIGNNLTLTAQEKKAIEEANNAQPTNMAARKPDVSTKEIDELREAFKEVADPGDDLPF